MNLLTEYYHEQIRQEYLKDPPTSIHYDHFRRAYGSVNKDAEHYPEVDM